MELEDSSESRDELGKSLYKLGYSLKNSRKSGLNGYKDKMSFNCQEEYKIFANQLSTLAALASPPTLTLRRLAFAREHECVLLKFCTKNDDKHNYTCRRFRVAIFGL